jgi:hypothetical protein
MVGKKKGKLKAVDTFRMALKYETLTKEGRRADRLDRYRWREGWERDTIERRFCYTTATAVALAMEEQEDSMLKVVAVDFAGKDAVLQGMRRTATDLQKVYLQLETVSKYGFKIAEKFFDRKSSVQGLTDEQEKLLKSIIKEESRESSGSKGKKGKKHDGKEELRGQQSGRKTRLRGGTRLGFRACFYLRAIYGKLRRRFFECDDGRRVSAAYHGIRQRRIRGWWIRGRRTVRDPRTAGVQPAGRGRR